MLGEFFVVAPADIDDEVVERGPHGRFSTVEANGLSNVPIARLGSLLGAGSYDELMAATDARPSSSGEAVLFQIPPQIRDALADAERVDDVGSAWAQTPELSLSGSSSRSGRRGRTTTSSSP